MLHLRVPCWLITVHVVVDFLSFGCGCTSDLYCEKLIDRAFNLVVQLFTHLTILLLFMQCAGWYFITFAAMRLINPFYFRLCLHWLYCPISICITFADCSCQTEKHVTAKTDRNIYCSQMFLLEFVFCVWQIRDSQIYCWRVSSRYLFFWTWERLLMSLMILFLYKCIKVVVINILKCVYVQSDLFNLFVSIYYKLVCVNYASLCSAVFWCLCQYTSDETFNRCCFSLALFF